MLGKPQFIKSMIGRTQKDRLFDSFEEYKVSRANTSHAPHDYHQNTSHACNRFYNSERITSAAFSLIIIIGTVMKNPGIRGNAAYIC